MTRALDGVDVCLGMPMGGILFADALAYEGCCRVAFAEKKIIALATETSREKSELTLGRHTINKGDGVAIIEDVVNNSSTTQQAINLIRDCGATPMAVVCILNRSDREHYDGSESLLIKSLVFRPFPQYKQNDPAVASDVESGNVVWKPKGEWPRLKAVMGQYRT
ncbi:MAG: phosphoribosyltransferase [Minisyncoccia bacterium]